MLKTDALPAGKNVVLNYYTQTKLIKTFMNKNKKSYKIPDLIGELLITFTVVPFSQTLRLMSKQTVQTLIVTKNQSNHIE